MLFQTLDSWEIDNPLIKSLHDQHTRIYPMVELATFSTFFILDLCRLNIGGDLEEEETQCWQILLIQSIDLALSIIKGENAIDHRISIFLQRNRSKDFEYSISTIDEIYISTDGNNNQAHLFVCANGIRHWEFGCSNEPEIESKDKKCINQRSNYRQ